MREILMGLIAVLVCLVCYQAMENKVVREHNWECKSGSVGPWYGDSGMMRPIACIEPSEGLVE